MLNLPYSGTRVRNTLSEAWGYNLTSLSASQQPNAQAKVPEAALPAAAGFAPSLEPRLRGTAGSANHRVRFCPESWLQNTVQYILCIYIIYISIDLHMYIYIYTVTV